MSDTIYCDTCRASGLRKMGCYCPVGWRYTEVPHNDDEIIIVACKPACEVGLWKSRPWSSIRRWIRLYMGSTNAPCVGCHTEDARGAWRFADVFYDDCDDFDDGCNFIVIATCSDACRAKFWRDGPGRLVLLDEAHLSQDKIDE